MPRPQKQKKNKDNKQKNKLSVESEKGTEKGFHVGEYVAQNAVSALSQGASFLGADVLAEKIENKRKRVMALGQKFDKKIKEEFQQFNDMGGISHVGEYVAQNAVSALSQGISALGDKELAQEIESKREQVVAQGRKFDKKVKEEYHQLNDMGGISHVGEYVAQNNVLALSRSEFIQSCPLKAKKIALSDGPKSSKIPQKKAYAKAELSMQNVSSSLVREVSFIDGKKHGAEIIRDGNNGIIDIKLFDHGKVIDLKSNKVEMLTDVDENGVKHDYCLLNGALFGTEMFMKDDKTYVRFYEKGGLIMNRDENSKISFHYNDASTNHVLKNMQMATINRKRR